MRQVLPLGVVLALKRYTCRPLDTPVRMGCNYLHHLDYPRGWPHAFWYGTHVNIFLGQRARTLALIANFIRRKGPVFLTHTSCVAS